MSAKANNKSLAKTATETNLFGDAETAPVSIRWTPSQQAGISAIGSSVLVSAAAGSGKTAVLAERCAELVCGQGEQCDIDELLVVTFTESAAAQMRSRIFSSLRKRAERTPNDSRLKLQLKMVERAQVNTIHGFCAALLRQQFDRAGLDPGFEILGPEEGMLLRAETMDELLQRRHEEPGNEKLATLLDDYAGGQDMALAEMVQEVHRQLGSMIDPAAWQKMAIDRIAEAAEKPLEKSTFGCARIEELLRELTAVVELGRQCVAEIAACGSGYEKHLAHAQLIYENARDLLKIKEASGLVAMAERYRRDRDEMPNSPAIRKNKLGEIDPAGAAVKQALDSFKNRYKRLTLECFSAEQQTLWQAGMRAILPHAETFLSLVREFSEAYDAAKREQGVLDFTDLERKTLEILRDPDGQPSGLARQLHRRFKHVLVDEYQDINPVQDALLGLLSRECLPETEAGNLFRVGDVKQSIFRFRLADPRLFLDCRRRFSKSDQTLGRVIDLRENFRSRAPLLAAINAVFERLMSEAAVEIEYDATQRLEAGRVFGEGNASSFAGAPIELHLLEEQRKASREDSGVAEDADLLDRTRYEAILVARRIQELMGLADEPRRSVVRSAPGEAERLEPIEYGDIVILLRTLKIKADVFSQVLRQHGIPVHSGAGGNLFEQLEVRDVLSLLTMLDNAQQDLAVAAVLRSPLAKLPQPEDALARIRLAYGDHDPAIPFHLAARRYASEQSDELAAKLTDFYAQIDRWRDMANKRPVSELLATIYDQTGYLIYCAGLEDGAQRVANLQELHGRAGQFSTFARQGLRRFMRFLEQLGLHQDVAQPSVTTNAAAAVRIMSVHVSKGLEFPVVIAADLGKGFNFEDTKRALLMDRDLGLGLRVVDQERMIFYPSLATEVLRNRIEQKTLAEEMRLLYVAMTRAKEHLILVGTCAANAMDSWRAMIAAIGGANGTVQKVPPDVVLNSKTQLGWIGPVAAMTENDLPAVFEVREYSLAELQKWKLPRKSSADFDAFQKSLVDLQPIAKASAQPTAAAAKVIDRFQKPYRFSVFTEEPASASVTQRAKKRDPELAVDRDEMDGEEIAAAIPLPRQLDLPAFFVEARAAKPTDIGNATHRVLEFWDFRRPGDAAAIDLQIAELVSRRLVSAGEAKLVDSGAIGWLMQQELGKTLAAVGDGLMREVPFARAMAGDFEPVDPMDQVMVRGRIDLLVPLADGVAVVDYKTDRVSERDIQRRTEPYRRQMQQYHEAIEKIAKQKVTAIYLVFLTPRVILKV